MFTLACVLQLTIPVLSSAAVFLPKTISVGDQAIYDAGKTVDIQFTDSSRTIGSQTHVEYGVAKATRPEELTFFEIITTEQKDISNLESMPRLSVEIPNIVATDATSTYVVYAKFFEKNNPENESFYFTKKFLIRANNTPFVQVVNVNLLQSTGARFDVLHGPSIYNPADAAQNKELATSTSIEITLRSNQDTVIAPTLSFTKMRSGVFEKTIELSPITVKKGSTYTVIPLPTFEYEPGVYMGSLSFNNNLIRNKIDLQYIVAGDSVSVGTVSLLESVDSKKTDALMFEIFGRPLDMDRSDYTIATSADAVTPDMYKAEVSFIDARGGVIYTTTQDVDFAQNNFTVDIPSVHKKFSQVHVVITSLSGKVVFEDTKDIDYMSKHGLSPAMINLIIYSALYLLLVLIVVIAIYKGHVKTAIICILLLIGLFATHKALALYPLDAYKVSGSKTLFRNEGVGMVPSVFLRDDVPNTTYTCGEAIPFVFKVYYLRCTNSTPNIKVAFSWTGFNNPSYSTISNTRDGDTYSATYRGHKFYKSYSTFVSKDLPAPTAINPQLYMTVAHSGGGGTDTGSVKYQIPIKTTCGEVPVSCSCVGRNQVCTKGGVGVSTTTNATQCGLQASCSYTQTGSNVTFTINTFNALGSLSYKDTETGATYSAVTVKNRPGTSTLSHKVTITDSFDNTQTYASCTVMGAPSTTCGGAGQPACTDSCGGPGQPACTSSTANASSSASQPNPIINSFNTSVPIVNKGDSCVYNWSVTDVNKCVVTVNNVSVPVPGDGLTGPVSVPSTNGLNQIAKITCIADASSTVPVVTVATTTLCQVNPEIRER